jgi:hypothetical protein
VPTDRDRYDYHRRRLMLTKDLDVGHREMLGYTVKCSGKDEEGNEIYLKYLICYASSNPQKLSPSIASVMRNRALQSEAGCEPLDRDRYDCHRRRLMLTDLDVYHREVLGATIIVIPDVYRGMPQRRLALARFIKDVWIATSSQIFGIWR